MDDPGSCSTITMYHYSSVSTLERLHNPFRAFR